MTDEFKNLTELFKSDKDTFKLGLTIAQNYKKEFLSYYGKPLKLVIEQTSNFLKSCDELNPDLYNKQKFENYQYWLNVTVEEYAFNLVVYNTYKIKTFKGFLLFIELKVFITRMLKKDIKEDQLDFLPPFVKQDILKKSQYVKYLKL